MNEQDPPIDLPDSDVPDVDTEQSENPAPPDAVEQENQPPQMPDEGSVAVDSVALSGDAMMPDAPADKTTESNAIPKIDNKTYQHLPHNLEVENALLGALLRNPNSFEDVSEIIRADYFYAAENQRLYDYITTISRKGQTANPATLKHVVESDELLAEMGGFDYLTSLVSNVISVVNVIDYAKTVAELHQKRQLIIIGETMANEGYDTANIEVTAEEQILKAEQKLYDLAETGDANRSSVTLSDANKDALKSIEAAYRRDGGLAGIETGFRDLNGKLGGFHKSDLLILAGRPAMGKTALAINCALRAAKAFEQDENGNTTQGGKVLFFSLEMSAEQLAGRILSQESDVSGDKMRRGDINQDEFNKVMEASRVLSSVPLMIDDTPGLSITGLRQRAKRVQCQYGLDMIMVDYLQLLSGPPDKKNDNRTQEVSDITRGLKIVAKELNVPVIALSQLSRTVESRFPPRPQLSDLRESGSIEQDADVVMFIYRQEYYLMKQQPERKQNEGQDKFQDRVENFNADLEESRNIAEIIIDKQRHGPVGTVDLFFDGETTKFGDLDKNH